MVVEIRDWAAIIAVTFLAISILCNAIVALRRDRIAPLIGTTQLDYLSDILQTLEGIEGKL
jgi:hypothetical protein